MKSLFSAPVTTLWLSWGKKPDGRRQLMLDGRPAKDKSAVTDKCRSLVAAGMPRNMLFEAKWKHTGTVSMRGNVHHMAKLTVVESERSGPRFGKWREFIAIGD